MYIPTIRTGQPDTQQVAGTGGGGGLMQPHLRFFWNLFFVNRSIVTIFFYSFPTIVFYVPPENFKTLTLLKFDQ